VATAAIPTPTQARGRLAERSRRGTEKDVLEARRTLAAAKIGAAIERTFAAEPRPTDEQIESLVTLLTEEASR